MADPHEAPEDETPIQRRDRLMNLTNLAWKPEPEAIPETTEALATAEPTKE